MAGYDTQPHGLTVSKHAKLTADSEMVLTAFEEHCGGLAVDEALASAIHQYQIRFVTKNADHIAFFGGHLMGVNPVKFLSTDENYWFDEILQTDAQALTHALSDFKELNNDRVVSSDVMNLSCLWLAHRLYHAKIKPELKEQAMISTMLVLQYKFTTSRLSRYFSYPADPAIAEATYASLSHKYAIKRFGSWSALFLDRAQDIIRPNGLHFKTIVNFAPDLKIVYMANDIQGRIRDLLKNIYGEHKRIQESGVRIHAVSNVAEFDGESVLKDQTKNLAQYRRYLESIVTDRHAFIREELLGVIFQLMPTASDKLIRETLLWMHLHFREGATGTIMDVMDRCLIHAFSYLNEERNYLHSHPDLASLLARLKGVYSSSRSTDQELMVLREKGEQLVTSATGNTSPAMVAAVRTSVLLYLVARTFTMRHYG